MRVPQSHRDVVEACRPTTLLPATRSPSLNSEQFLRGNPARGHSFEWDLRVLASAGV